MGRFRIAYCAIALLAAVAACSGSDELDCDEVDQAIDDYIAGSISEDELFGELDADDDAEAEAALGRCDTT